MAALVIVAGFIIVGLITVLYFFITHREKRNITAVTALILLVFLGFILLPVFRSGFSPRLQVYATSNNYSTLSEKLEFLQPFFTIPVAVEKTAFELRESMVRGNKRPVLYAVFLLDEGRVKQWHSILQGNPLVVNKPDLSWAIELINGQTGWTVPEALKSVGFGGPMINEPVVKDIPIYSLPGGADIPGVRSHYYALLQNQGMVLYKRILREKSIELLQ
jgi:hypothetical protein